MLSRLVPVIKEVDSMRSFRGDFCVMWNKSLILNKIIAQMKKSTDGMSNKEKTIFQDMLVKFSKQIMNMSVDFLRWEEV